MQEELVMEVEVEGLQMVEEVSYEVMMEGHDSLSNEILGCL